MRPRRKPNSGMAGSHRRRRGWGEGSDDILWLDGEEPEAQPPPRSQPPMQPHQAQQPQPSERAHRHPGDFQSQAPQVTPASQRTPPPRQMPGPAIGDPFDSTGPIARTASGWRVGDEEVSDLTSAMVLADLLAADLPTESMPAIRSAPPASQRQRRPQRAPQPELPDAQRLRQTVAQL